MMTGYGAAQANPARNITITPVKLQAAQMQKKVINKRR
jgi:hypothetical protein